jgi:hypothetical protein
MDVIQRRFKSSVYRMNRVKGYAHAVPIEEQKKLLAMRRTTRGQLREGDRAWKGRLWENYQTMNKNLMRGRQSRKSGHNVTKSCHSALEVNEAFGWWWITTLPGDVSWASEKSAEVIVPESRTGRMKEA